MTQTEQEIPEKKGLFSRTFQAFRYREFRLLWAGAFTSTTGSWMQLVAQSWLVLELTKSPFYLGLTGFLGQLPHILFSLLGGALADRIERRRLLLYSQYAQMATAGILTILVLLDWIEVWHLLSLVFVAGTAQAFGGPAYQALIPGLVPRKDLPNAVALNSIQFNLARVVGPLLAALALATLGAGLCFGLNGLSFLAVIIALLAIRPRFVPRENKDSVVAEIGQGLSFVKERSVLWRLTILGFSSTFCGVPLLTLLPAFVKDVFQAGSTEYSIMMALSGSGAVVGALLYASVSRMGRQGLLVLCAQLVFASLLVAFAFSRSFLLSCLILFLSGTCLIALFAAITSLVQLTVIDEMRGRVMSIFFLAFRGGMPLGDLLAGTIASQFSLSSALLVLGILLGSVAAGFLVFDRVIKRL
jgi:MFS family permease